MIATLIAGSLMVPLPATTADAPAPTRGAVTLAQRSQLEVAELTVVTPGGEVAIRAEVALTPEEQARGLMFRRSLAPKSGMIFIYTPPQPVSMWMKNTLISLDMLFIDANGRIQRIARRTEPYSERVIPSGGPVVAVLELAGGAAERLGITVGSTIDLTALLTRSG